VDDRVNSKVTESFRGSMPYVLFFSNKFFHVWKEKNVRRSAIGSETNAELESFFGVLSIKITKSDCVSDRPEQILQRIEFS